jgi:hypothetical protein
MLRLAQPILRPVLRRQFKGYYAELKRLLESRPRASVGVADAEA